MVGFRPGPSECPAPADQVDDQDDHGDDEKKVNQAAGDVEAETQEPQDQNDYKNCPEHRILFSALSAPSRFGSGKGARNAFTGLVRCNCLCLRVSDCFNEGLGSGRYGNIALQDAAVGDVAAVDGPCGIFVVAD
jgi:hypothetical protein